MLWISHRGESYDAPENTMRAFRLAWERDTDGIELDIRLTADGQVVCIHDAETGRVGDKNLVIAETGYNELVTVDMGKGERIPLLSEVLAEAPKNKIIYIEIKSGPEILPLLREIIKNSNVPAEMLKIIDFKNDNLVECKKILPHIETYLLSGVCIDEKTGNLAPLTQKLLELKNKSKIDGFDLSACESITKEYLTALQQNDKNVKIAVWTINDIPRAKQFVELGVDAITSDRAAFLQNNLEV